MKKFLAGLLALVMVLSLAACGGGSGSTKDPGGSQGPGEGPNSIEDPWWKTTGTLEKDANGVVFDDVSVKLTSIVAGQDQAAFEQIIAEFNALYMGRINIELTTVAQNSFASTVGQQVQQNSNPPDLIMTHSKWLNTFSRNEIIQPLDEAIEVSGINISMNDYYTGLAQYADAGYEGYLFGVPIDTRSQVVLYNKQLLMKYNGGNLPANRQELLDLCAKAKADGKTAIAWNDTEEFFVNHIFTTAIVQNGGSIYDPDTFRANWYSDEANRASYTAAVNSIKELVSNGYAKFGTSENAAAKQFVENNALFYVTMPWLVSSTVTSYGKQNGNLSQEATMSDRVGGTSIAGWFAMDSANPNAGKIFGESHFFAMTSAVEDINVAAAICEFIRWYTQTASVGIDWADAGHVSASTIVSNDAAYNESAMVSNFMTSFYPNISDFVLVGNTPYYDEAIEKLTSLYEKAKNEGSGNYDSILSAEEENLNGMIDFMED